MSLENCLKSITSNYLHFNRVDNYTDFVGADRDDGSQTPADRVRNRSAYFAKKPNFSAEDYYDICRSRTYTCCFSLENSGYIWRKYGNGGSKGKVCFGFHFGKMKFYLDEGFAHWFASIENQKCIQIFNLNYGLIQYINRSEYLTNHAFLSNPIIYSFLKDSSFSEEKELRISLSANGFGNFRTPSGQPLEFPLALSIPFDFREAYNLGAICEVICSEDCDMQSFSSELERVGISLLI